MEGARVTAPARRRSRNSRWHMGLPSRPASASGRAGATATLPLAGGTGGSRIEKGHRSGGPRSFASLRMTSRAAARPAMSVVVRGLAVRRDVEAFALVLFADTQPDRQVDQLVGDERDDSRPDDRHEHRLQLDPDLVEDAHRADRAGHPVRDLPRAAEQLGVEDAGEQRADDAADAMDAEDVERVVGAEHALEAVDAPQAGETGDEADDEGAEQADVAARRRDRDQAGDGA